SVCTPFCTTRVAPRQRYSFPTRRSSDLRNMGILGTVLLVFIVTHMQNFWYQYKFGSTPYVEYHTELATGNQEIISLDEIPAEYEDRKSTRLNSSHVKISYAVFCLKKKKR